MSTVYGPMMIQDAPDGPGVLTPDDDGKFMMWDGSRRQMVMAAIRMTGQANTILRSGGYRIQDSSDGPGVLTAGDDGKALVWDNGTARFVMTAFEASGAVAAHVALADPHTQYELKLNNDAAAILAKILTVDGAGSGLDADLLDGNSSAAFLLATGATAGATSQAQTFTNGINGGIAANDDITINGTSHATKTSSYVLLQPSGGFVGVGTTAPEVPLHLVGTNGEIRLQNVATDASNKFGRFTVANYTNGALPFLGFNITSLSTSTLASFGGSSSVAYAVTRLSFYAAANNSTTTGTEVVRVNVNGMSVGTAADPTAVLHVAASTTARASLCLPHGSAPTSPVNGDMWTTTAGLYVRINGVTVGPLS